MGWGGSESYVPSLSPLADRICKPKAVVHTFTFHTNCKIGSSDRLDMSGVAVWKEKNGIGSESCAPSLPHLTDDPICKPKVIVHTFTFHANCKIGSSDRLDICVRRRGME